MDNICTSDVFCGHKDPYTGDPIEIRLVVVRGLGARYQIEGAYSLATPYATRQDAVRAWARVAGVVGMRDASKGFRCAYTGDIVTPFSDAEGHKFRGGFRPELLRTRSEILDVLGRISGKSYTPDTGDRVDAVSESAPMARTHAPSIGSYADDAAASVLESCGVKPGKSVRGARKIGRAGR